MIHWPFQKWLANAGWCAATSVLTLVLLSIGFERLSTRGDPDGAIVVHQSWSFGQVGPVLIVILGMAMWAMIAVTVLFLVLGCIRFAHELAMIRHGVRVSEEGKPGHS